ncbi:hypothetical protein SAMN05192561_11258 [Halopenitus malekzadehii]|uniref:Winged helix-turn-helix DNA-binding n=1 Tax=Halopenitus malekzadehii TaxID=1267564 RepID=A0A1H6JNU9_9EURY|nr:winged helix-turn-helix domain-containing protein [Halopenitus malekzadehii]SEH60965.1 hypothetical protein SAMN05192561_11258 [Halopenitus malekzadehii]
MTAHEPNRSRSDNSVLQTETLAPSRDPRTRRIIDYVVNNPGSSATLRDIAVETGEPLRDITAQLDRLEKAGYVELLDKSGCCIVLPTFEGEQLVQEGR